MDNDDPYVIHNDYISDNDVIGVVCMFDNDYT